MHSGAEKWLEALSPYAIRHHQACMSARESQLLILKSMVKANLDCVFGREHGFEEIDDYGTFTQHVPLRDYDDFSPWIDRLALGEQGVLTTEMVIGFEQTSGTTSARKLIPYTETFRQQMAVAVGGWMAKWQKNYPQAFGGRSYWSLSPAGMTSMVLPSGVQVGMDGDGGYFPKDVAAPLAGMLIFPEMDGDYMKHTASALLEVNDLSSISVWSPTFLIEIDRQIRLIDPLFKTWSDNWRHLDVVSCWGDVQAARWLPQLSSILGEVKVELKGLMSTEGVFSIPTLSGDAELAVGSHFYEFIESNGKIWLCDELSVGVQYEIAVTNGAGLYRYKMGDKIEVTAMSETGVPSFKFVGRGGGNSDLVGEKLSEAFVSACLQQCQVAGVLIACDDHYILVANDVRLGEEFSKALLKSPYYHQAIVLGQLKPLRCVLVSDGQMFAWSEQCAAATGARVGDVKLPSLVTSDLILHRIILQSL